MRKMIKGTVIKDIPDNLISDYEKLGWEFTKETKEVKEVKPVEKQETEEPKEEKVKFQSKK